MTLHELKAARAAARAKCKALVDTAEARPKEQQFFSDEEKRDFDAAMKEQDGFSERISRLEAVGTTDDRSKNNWAFGGTDTRTSRREGSVNLMDSKGREVRGYRGKCTLLEERLQGVEAADVLADPEFHLGGRLLSWELSGRKSALPRELRSIGETVNTQGGYLTATELLDAWFISRAAPATVAMRLGATMVPMSTDKSNIATHESGPGWVTHSENTEETEYSVVFGAKELSAKTRHAWFTVSREWIADAVNGLPLLEQTLISEAAVDMDEMILVGGTGGVNPTGILSDCTTNAVAVGGAITYAKLFEALENVRADNITPTGLVLHPTIETDIFQLLTNSETNHFAPMPEPLASLTRLTTTAATTAYGFLGDWTKVYVGMRQGVEFQVGQKPSKNAIELGVTYRIAPSVSHEPCMAVMTGITT